MAKYKKQPPEKWENQGKNERFLRLHIGLIESSAYKSLNSRQRDLYTHMKLQYRGRESSKNPNGKKEQFTFSWSMANKIYEMYSNRNTFYNDIKVLIDTGFIECVEYGRYEKKKTVYAFSDKWKNTS